MEAGTELSEGYCGGNRKSSSPLVEKTTALLAPWSATATQPFAINVVPYGDFREPGANSDATGLFERVSTVKIPPRPGTAMKSQFAPGSKASAVGALRPVTRTFEFLLAIEYS